MLRAVFETRTGEQQDVQPSVVVVVEERAAASDRFENEGRRVGRTVDHRLRQAGLGGHIRQARPEGDPGWLAAPLRPHVTDGWPLRRQGRGGEAKPLTAGPPHRHSRRERLGYHGRQIDHRVIRSSRAGPSASPPDAPGRKHPFPVLDISVVTLGTMDSGAALQRELRAMARREQGSAGVRGRAGIGLHRSSSVQSRDRPVGSARPGSLRGTLGATVGPQVEHVRNA